MYVNGTLQTATYSGTESLTNGANRPVIGTGAFAITPMFDGYISDLRVVTSLDTSAYSVPTERMSAITNTQLLTCHLPYIADGSSNGHSITVNGNTSTTPIGPYDYAEYSESNNGGSVYFDGTSSYLQIAGSTDFAPSTDQFTLKFWYYPKIQPTTTFLVRQGTNTSGEGYWVIAHYSNGRIRRMQNVGGSFSGVYSANDVIKIGQWHYIEFYQNGASTGELKVNGTSILTGDKFCRE